MTSKKKTTKRPKLKTQYTNYEQVAIKFEEATNTQQNFKEECDINNVMRRFQATGEVPGHLLRDRKYGIQPPDDLTALRFLTAHLKSEFELLPEEEKENLSLDQYLDKKYKEQSANANPESVTDEPQGEAEAIQDSASDSAQEQNEAESI